MRYDLTPQNVCVSIHAPTRGATIGGMYVGISLMKVSIHAPTRGATPGVRAGEYPLVVSIHAPTRGATVADFINPLTNWCFNPRTHTGCDIYPRYLSLFLYFVSIHAPTRGATVQVGQWQRSDPQFQSTHPHGVRQCAMTLRHRTYVSIHAPTRGGTVYRRRVRNRKRFQSTHPHGVRLNANDVVCRYLSSFNPRTHTGCDFRKASKTR